MADPSNETMAKNKNQQTFQTQATQHTDEEALHIAKATQTPGQTKEQTKLIAKGIAKGVAHYKKQEKVKQRERSKQQRKSKRATEIDTHEKPGDLVSKPEAETFRGKFPLRIAASLFGLAGLLHLVRYFCNTSIIIDSFTIPVNWSLPAAIVTLALSAWLFRHS